MKHRTLVKLSVVAFAGINAFAQSLADGPPISGGMPADNGVAQAGAKSQER